MGVRDAQVERSVLVALEGVSPLRHPSRCYATSSDSTHMHYNSAASADADDWSTIVVEVLQPEVEPIAPGARVSSSSTATDATTRTTNSTTAAGQATASHSHPSPPLTSAEAVQSIDAIDTYAKAKVMNFVRRQQQLHPQSYGSSSSSGGAAAVSSASSSPTGTTIPGMEVREVQRSCSGGDGADATQFHARWRLPLPAEYGERFGEGFAPTAKEAESVAAMHAERVIDALGFPLFLLSSKQRKHAEAARAAGRWAPLPPAADQATAVAEVVPSPETPSPPPLQLHRVSAREQRERQLHIDHAVFTPVEKGFLTPLSCTLASPHNFDPMSVRRIRFFFKAHRVGFLQCLRFFLLRDGGGGGPSDAGAPQVANVFLAQLTLPLPPRFGIRVAMGRGPTKKDAVTLACMHAELIIDAVGFALYPANHQLQAKHAEECAQVRRWCAPPGNCDYRYTVASPAPLELVDKLDPAAAAAEASLRTSAVDGHEVASDALRHGELARASVASASNAEIQVGATSSGSVESILLQHQRAVAAASKFVNEVSMRDYENARLLLERYLAQFAVAAPSTPSTPAASPLRSLMFVETLGQRDRAIYRATITVPLVEPAATTGGGGVPAADAAAAPNAPLPFTQSFVAIGISDTSDIAELAASLHALRTLAALNRLTLLRGSPAVLQALESFARRGQLPLYDPARPMLHPAAASAEESLPAAVRVMDGVIGRVTSSGLVYVKAEARARVFTPGVKVQSRSAEMRAVKLDSIPQRHNREDFLLRELHAARLRVPRLEWDTTADAKDRIVVAPDANPQTAREYLHTLSSVRNPDKGSAQRIRDYLERHGKTRNMVSTITRVPVDASAPKEGFMFVAKLVLPMPEGSRRRAREDDAAGMAAAAPREEKATWTAQGEAPTREEAVLLCDAHAELLLDALGVPLYDHPMLQRKHADAARALGRWAPLGRGGLLAPAALRPVPPPLRKVTKESALWTLVQQQQQRRTGAAAAAAKVSRCENGNGGAAYATSAAATTAAAAPEGDDVNDEALCDISRMRYVHSSGVFHLARNYIQRYFEQQGLDVHRMVRQYKVNDPKLGIVHRAILEMPTPAVYGKRYAVGLADTRRNALHLCCQHALYILDALHIPPHKSRALQRRYTRIGAIKGRKVAQRSDGRAAPDTPTPPGYYSLELSEAATMQPSTVPARPTRAASANEMVWRTYLQHCGTYLRQRADFQLRRAVSALPVPGAPRSGLPAEDAMLDLAEAAPLEQGVRRQLRDLCAAAGLPNAVAEHVPYESVKLTTEKRVYVTTYPLLGTPYTMRGFSSENGQESRQRAMMHGVQILQRLVRANDSAKGKARCGWAEGIDRRVSMLDPFTGAITHHGRVWVLRTWGAMHFPPRMLQLVVREETGESAETAADHGGAALTSGVDEAEQSDAASNSSSTNAANNSHSDDAASAVGVSGGQASVSDVNRPQCYHASVAVLECGNKANLSDVVLKETHVAAGLDDAAAVHGAVHRVFFALQRMRTMQTLHRFLLRQPQLHLPSLRILHDPDGVVAQLPSLLPESLPAATSTVAEAPFAALLLHSSASLSSLPMFRTWPVEVLLRWVRVHGGVTNSASLADRQLPSTLAPLFLAYGLVTAAAGSGPPVAVASDAEVPSRMAAALGLLCHCLPPPPTPSPPPSSASADVTSFSSHAVARDSSLPLQLAHVLLMGLLLDCAPWAVRLVAMVACIEDTLTWYARARRSSRQPLLPPSSPSEATIASALSVDVVEAVLLSLNATAPPLPPAVQTYACEVAQRLSRIVGAVQRHTELLHTASAEAVAVEENVEGGDAGACQLCAADVAWLSQTEAVWAKVKAVNQAVSTASPLRLSVPEVQTLRSLLQCAVAASAAPHEVWVRAGRTEDLVRALYNHEDDEESAAADHGDGDGDDGSLPSSEEVFVFQGRRTAPFAALCVNGQDLTRTDADALHTLSSMATVFVALGCAVHPAAPAAATSSSVTDDVCATPAAVPFPSAAVSKHASSLTTGGEGDDEGEGGDNEAGREDKADAEMSTKEEEEEEERVINPTCFVRVLGTCVTPLAAVMVGQQSAAATSSSPPRTSSHSSSPALADRSALRLADEDLPMLLTAFNEIIPLVVHDSKSSAVLRQLAAHLRSRVDGVRPFTAAERQVLCRLLALRVDAVKEDHIDDA